MTKRKPTRNQDSETDRALRFLSRYRPAAERVTLLQRRLERLRERAESPPGPVLDGLPRTRARPDRIGDLLARIDECKADLEAAQAEAATLRQEIKKKITAIPSDSVARERQRTVLQARHLDGETWGGVAWCLFGDREDFDDKTESYTRQCHRIHGEALQELSKILMEE